MPLRFMILRYKNVSSIGFTHFTPVVIRYSQAARRAAHPSFSPRYLFYDPGCNRGHEVT